MTDGNALDLKKIFEILEVKHKQFLLIPITYTVFDSKINQVRLNTKGQNRLRSGTTCEFWFINVFESIYQYDMHCIYAGVPI